MAPCSRHPTPSPQEICILNVVAIVSYSSLLSPSTHPRGVLHLDGSGHLLCTNVCCSILYRQLVREGGHESVDERRVNLLKSQLIQLERQVKYIKTKLYELGPSIIYFKRYDTHEAIFDMYQRYILFDFRQKKLYISTNFIGIWVF